MTLRTIILIVFTCLLAGCALKDPDRRLADIAASVDDNPRLALTRLDSISPESLSPADRHFYDFLRVKAADKAYIPHSSDSLILDVIEFEAAHRGTGRYPEALYYGGRVYSDLGDYPTALRYFQDALDMLPEKDGADILRGCILSQTGRLLNTLRLYDEAAPYIKSSIDSDCLMGDTLNEVYDLQLLGTVYLRTRNFSGADSCFRSALDKSRNMDTTFRAKSSMYMAQLKLISGQIDSALLFIRNIPDKVKPIARNSALATAAEIYLAAGLTDSAYLFAHELVNSNDLRNKKTGYLVILSPELKGRLHPDTAARYVSEYTLLLESYFDDNTNQLAINQQSFHNYHIHQRERIKAENQNTTLRRWIVISAIILILIGWAVLFMKKRNAEVRLELRAALINIERLRESLERGVDSANTENKDIPDIVNSPPPLPADKNDSAESLRQMLREKLLEISRCNQHRTQTDPHIQNSEICGELNRLVTEGRPLPDDSHLWTEIEAMVISRSPDFVSNLRLLVGGRLSTYDLRTALLIKCGFQPARMAVLLNRSKNTIVSRRDSMCRRIFGEKLGTKVIDDIIRIL